MATFSTKSEIKSPIDKVWNIISDTDKDTEYWYGIKSINNLKKDENIIERQTTIAFRKSKCKEIVTLDKGKNQVVTEIIEGPIIGKKIISLKPINEQVTEINVNWEIQMRGIMGIFTIFIKKHILKGTQEAILRIKKRIESP